MSPIHINFQYNTMTVNVHTAAECLPSGAVTFYDWQMCFDRLASGGNFSVDCSVQDLRNMIDYVKHKFITVKAAGGIVRNLDGQLLVMTRNGRADLPKGKVEEGETLAQAALRETSEETGLTKLSLGRLLTKTYHIYDLYGGWHFKQTTWYAMELTEEEPVVPQVEEGITEVEWVGEDEWRRRLGESYATMKLLTGQIIVK